MYAGASAYGYPAGNATGIERESRLGFSPAVSQPGQHVQQQQQPQHVMYNSQQYGPNRQSLYGGVPDPGKAGNAGAMVMVPNNAGMAQMPDSHATYQTSYSSSPYRGVPISTAANLPPNFMPATSNTAAFAMISQIMNSRNQAERMQPPPSATPTKPGQRTSPFPGQSESSKTDSDSTNAELPTWNKRWADFCAVEPGLELREKERVTKLLDINACLLKEVMLIQAIQAEVKRDEAAEKEKAEKEKATKLQIPCMRRLQSNLAYLAAIADRSHKPSSQILAHPAIMSSPLLLPKPLIALPPTAPDETKKEDSEDKDCISIMIKALYDPFFFDPNVIVQGVFGFLVRRHPATMRKSEDVDF
ncbi:hypothetical protein V8E51_018638 [Hyaloscypha variabilis]